MSRKTIIMLSAKRCGSTAIFKMFQKHPQVGVCHVNKGIKNWEPNFWNLGAEAIQGCPNRFLARFKESHPFLDIPNNITEETLFRLWDDILEELGPVVFDKSPQYLGNEAAFNLLKKYKNKGNDVRLFAFIRDPRDAITSQYELWKSYVKDDSLKKREIAWLEKYSHLEYLQENFKDIPLFRYEDFTSRLSYYAPMIFKHCGCADVPEAYEHIKPTHIGRYSASILPRVRIWEFSDEFVEHLMRYGYKIPQLTLLERIKLTSQMLIDNIWREIKSIKVRIKNGLTRRPN